MCVGQNYFQNQNTNETKIHDSLSPLLFLLSSCFNQVSFFLFLFCIVRFLWQEEMGFLASSYLLVGVNQSGETSGHWLGGKLAKLSEMDRAK